MDTIVIGNFYLADLIAGLLIPFIFVVPLYIEHKINERTKEKQSRKQCRTPQRLKGL